MTTPTIAGHRMGFFQGTYTTTAVDRPARVCAWPGCSATLAADNRSLVCSCHPPYVPEHDPALYIRVLDLLLVHQGERVDVCRAFGVRTLVGHRTICKTVEKARRHGCHIVGYRAAGYMLVEVAVERPERARTPSHPRAGLAAPQRPPGRARAGERRRANDDRPAAPM